MGVFQELESEYDYEIVEEFFGHYSQMVENMESLIISLDSKEAYGKNINELFRMFHTIKSGSAYLKIEPVRKLVTLVEEVLQECRELDASASEELINWLLSVSDQLNLYKEDLENDKEEFSRLNHAIIKVPTVYVK